jgi:hypothetical protein
MKLLNGEEVLKDFGDIAVTNYRVIAGDPSENYTSIALEQIACVEVVTGRRNWKLLLMFLILAAITIGLGVKAFDETAPGVSSPYEQQAEIAGVLAFAAILAWLFLRPVFLTIYAAQGLITLQARKKREFENHPPFIEAAKLKRVEELARIHR